jgi:hypothetical protein
VVADGEALVRILNRGVDDGAAAQRGNGSRSNERHEGELDVVAMVEGCLALLAQARNARHVDLVNGVNVWADAHALDHTFGDDGPHAGERNEIGRKCCEIGRRRHLRRLRWGWLLGWRLCKGRARRAQNIVFSNAAFGARACDAADFEAVLLGDAAGERRRADATTRRDRESRDYGFAGCWRGNLRLRRRLWNGGLCGRCRRGNL